MSKRLLLIRHSIAEASNKSDFDRNLTESGKEVMLQNSIELNSFLQENSIELDFCFYSSSKRTVQTFEILNNTIKSSMKAHQTRLLYLTGMKELKTLFKTYSNEIEDCENIVIVAHNAGISNIASMLIGSYIYMNPGDINVLDINVDETWLDLLDYEGSWDIIYGK
jgi:phosphohistidine phosphatase SixA